MTIVVPGLNSPSPFHVSSLLVCECVRVHGWSICASTFLFARGLTPPLFRTECQLEDLTRYTMWSVLLREKGEIESRRSSNRCTIAIARSRGEMLLRASNKSEESQPDRNWTRFRNVRRRNWYLFKFSLRNNLKKESSFILFAKEFFISCWIIVTAWSGFDSQFSLSVFSLGFRSMWNSHDERLFHLLWIVSPNSTIETRLIIAYGICVVT